MLYRSPFRLGPSDHHRRCLWQLSRRRRQQHGGCLRDGGEIDGRQGRSIRYGEAGSRSCFLQRHAEASFGIVSIHRGFHSDERAKSDRYFVELQPPSTRIVCPLMKLPPGEQRNATVLAMSSTVPSRGKGVISTLILRNRSSCKRCSTIGVMVTPGATALQRMPCAPY